MFCPTCGKNILDGSTFCSHCGKLTGSVMIPAIAPAPAGSKKSSLFGISTGFKIILLILAALIVYAFYVVHTTPQTQNIYVGKIVVAAGQQKFWTVTVSPSMVDAQLVGSFHASGGTGNDIQVAIMSESEFENWKNSHQAGTYYSTGRTTSGEFNVRVAPGRYVIAFNNTFSLLSEKSVTVQMEIRYHL